MKTFLSIKSSILDEMEKSLKNINFKIYTRRNWTFKQPYYIY